jgi:hypothetical protein
MMCVCVCMCVNVCMHAEDVGRGEGCVENVGDVCGSAATPCVCMCVYIYMCI